MCIFIIYISTSSIVSAFSQRNKISVKKFPSKWNITWESHCREDYTSVIAWKQNASNPTRRKRDRNLLPVTEIDRSYYRKPSPALPTVSLLLSHTLEWARRDDRVCGSTYLRTASRPELAIQVFKGHYKSDKPDGVISNGEAEVRHYAMETSISGGIVATICFSLFTRSPRRTAATFFFL